MEYIKEMVDKYKRRFKSTDPFYIAEELNCIIIETPMHKDTRGFYQYFQRNKIIYINKNLLDEEKRVVCAHELGHAILHTHDNLYFIKNYTLFEKNKYEIAANYFAAELLITDDTLLSYKDYTIDEISKIEKVPTKLIELKFRNFNKDVNI